LRPIPQKRDQHRDDEQAAEDHGVVEIVDGAFDERGGAKDFGIEFEIARPGERVGAASTCGSLRGVAFRLLLDDEEQAGDVVEIIADWRGEPSARRHVADAQGVPPLNETTVRANRRHRRPRGALANGEALVGRIEKAAAVESDRVLGRFHALPARLDSRASVGIDKNLILFVRLAPDGDVDDGPVPPLSRGRHVHKANHRHVALREFRGRDADHHHPAHVDSGWQNDRLTGDDRQARSFDGEPFLDELPRVVEIRPLHSGS